MKSKWTRLLALVMCFVMVFAFTACDEKPDKDSEGGNKPSGDVINAVDYGIDNTGATDETQNIMAMHKEGAESGKAIYYPNGTYLFNGLTLDFTSGVQFESQDGVLIRNSISDTPIVNFDDEGNLIGLMHNHLELDNNDMYVVSGNLVSPPLSDAEYETNVEFLPYWYNDFGLQGAHGSKQWYYWSWNFHDTGDTAGNDPYDPQLHPLLGFYRGDEVEVLDWMSYWLKEYGMNQAILYHSGAIDASKWTDPNCQYYWIYQLLTNVPNGKLLDYACFVEARSYSTPEEEVRAAWDKTIASFYFNEEYADQMYYYEKDGKKYPVLTLWDEQALRYAFGQGETGTTTMVNMYKDYAQMFKDNGYDGICILARTSCLHGENNAAIRADLLANDVLWLACDYPKNGVGNGPTYEERVNQFLKLDDISRVYGVATGMDSHTPHPSNWSCPGTTPELFSKWISNVVSTLDSEPNRDRIITCYNISEWGEGGPGLVPTVADRFGYLEAIRDNIVVK